MIINKISEKNNAKLIAKKYVEWVDSGISPSKILVLTFNSLSKKNIIKTILKTIKKDNLSDIKIHTFNGLIYNSIIDNWAILENNLEIGNPVLLPNLSELEISQYLLKQIIKEEEVKGYNSKKSLLHQIFRRASLIINNNLTPYEVSEKSKILKEAFSEDAEKIIQRLKAVTLSYRAFDNIRQAQIFPYIYKNTDYFKDIKYLIAEDTDEATPLFFDFLTSISNQIVDQYILLDKEGCSRCGYLCADITAPQRLEEIFSEKIKDKMPVDKRIDELRENILEDKRAPLSEFEVLSLSKRADMIDYTIKQIKDLITSGIEPTDISIITPIQDKMLKYTLKIGFTNYNPVFLSGNEKLIENPLVRAVLTVMKLTLNKPVEVYELRVILSKYLGIPVKLCFNIDSTLPKIDLGIYTDRYNEFCLNIKELQSKQISPSQKAYFAYTKLFHKVNKSDLAKFNFFLKELQNFEKIFGTDMSKEREADIITQLENSIMSENPYATLELSKNDLIISTPQKIIDNKISTKYQFWLDVSSQEWVKPDTGPLYNAWVFQKSWNKNEYSIEDNIRLSKQKTYRVLRKLLLNTTHVTALSSLFDTQGVENLGGIEQYLVSEHKQEPRESDNFKIIPRPDQKPVLEYKSGSMAISAVPGAGKTTILLGLIIELLNRDISPENIYVLTYMESAARTFKDRITSAINNGKLPNISTIHGLALRILKENANYERLGFNADFEICDDTQRGRIIKSLSNQLQKQELDEFDRAISVFKLSKTDYKNNPEIKRLLNLKKGTQNDMKLARFLKFFLNYQQKLVEENLIDYDDILISAVKLLEENNDILEYYQNICEYIIEDEAQDSSSIQQRLINLLSAKHKNLIRCGDINQAITTTFTNADVEGFKRFMETSERVNMDCSQRCSEGVWSLANKLVSYGNSKIKPFYEIFMKPVEGKNPVEQNPVFSKIYKTGIEEKLETVKEIKKLLSDNPKATIGILLRNNYQVNSWAGFLTNSGLSAITRNECLAQKKIFKIIFSILKFISEPYNNSTLAQAYKSLSEIGIFKPHLEKIIEGSEKSYITFDNDNIADYDLSRFHWDMNYWLSFPELGIDELATMIGLYYFSDNLDKSNIHLISTLCAKLDNGNFSQTVQRLEELSNRPTLSGFKFFSEEDEKDLTGGKVQIMTMHKSKGDEFDYVFLPEMSEKNLTLDMEQLKLKKSSDFMENLRALNLDYKPKSEFELKEFLISENYRLLYVGITRAKRRLYFSTSATELYFGRQKESIPSIIFDELL